MVVLNTEQKLFIASMSPHDLIDLRFSLGMAIRNAFCLNNPDSELLKSCATDHPDDAAGVIILDLWVKLTLE